MKRKMAILIAILSIMLFPNSHVFAEDAKLVVNGEEYTQEVEDAGFTREQFKKIMEMPQTGESEPVIQQMPRTRSFSPQQSRSISPQQSVVNKALSYLGVPYVWGGTTPSGFDCSGLVQYVYKYAPGVNIDLPRVTYQQEYCGNEVSLNNLELGDLLFFGIRGSTHHVAIYIGNGQFVQAPQPGDVVKVTNMRDYRPDFARRIITKMQEETLEIPVKVGEISVGTNVYYQEGKLTNSADTVPGNDPYRGTGSAWVKSYTPGKNSPYLLVKNGVNIGYTTRKNIQRVNAIPANGIQEGANVICNKYAKSSSEAPTISSGYNSYWVAQYIDGNAKSPYRLLKNGKTIGYTDRSNLQVVK